MTSASSDVGPAEGGAFELLCVSILHLAPSLCLEVRSPGVSVGSELLGCGLWLWEGIQAEFLACDSCESSVSTAGWKDREGQALPLPCPVEGRCCLDLLECCSLNVPL